MRPRSSVLLVVGLGLGGVVLPSAAQTVHEKVSVEVITVRLTARDASGKRVEDLEAPDLVLTVDGKPVSIETFSGPENLSGSKIAEVTGPAAGRPDGAAPRSLDDAPLRTMIFVDVAGTHPFERKDVCAELNRFVRASGPANREFLVAQFDGKRVGMETGWTRDPEAAAAALQRIGSGSALNVIESPGTVAASTGPLAFSSGTWLQITAERFHEAMLEALAAFPHAPGQGRLLVVSGGTSLMRPQDLNSILACQITPSERSSGRRSPSGAAPSIPWATRSRCPTSSPRRSNETSC
jgi:VWFA-related protein